MTTKNTFELTVRKEDLLELYKDQTEFKLFSKAYAGRLFFIVVALLLGGITLVASFYSSKYVFYALLFMGGIVYCVYHIWKSYSTKQEKKQSVEAWADEVLKFKKHELTVNDVAVVYRRDDEFFTYTFDTIHTHDATTYFQILVNDGSELLIPQKAFAANEYDAFIQSINEKKNNAKDLV
ncbi:MAG: hypothetical protein JWM14_1572 [Chitinophagaceae bacterium]|nr:hypothetical protein [Chitinophagaceae bacterium]